MSFTLPIGDLTFYLSSLQTGSRAGGWKGKNIMFILPVRHSFSDDGLILSKKLSLVTDPALSLRPPVFRSAPTCNDILSLVGSSFYQGSSIHGTSLIRKTTPVITFPSFRTVGSIIEPSPFNPRAPPSMIRNENLLIHLPQIHPSPTGGSPFSMSALSTYISKSDLIYQKSNPNQSMLMGAQHYY